MGKDNAITLPKKRIVFMGAGLNALSKHIIEQGVVGIIDGGKVKKGIKQRIKSWLSVQTLSDISKHKKIPYLHYESSSAEERNAFLRQLNCDVLIVFSLSHLLPKSFFDTPKIGTFNFHPSLLPDYKGPHPNFWVLRNGEKATGITLHRLDEGEDSGPIVLKSSIEITKNDSMKSLIAKQMEVAKNLYKHFLLALEHNTLEEFPQKGGNTFRAKRITPKNYLNSFQWADWTHAEVLGFIRKTEGLAIKALPNLKTQKLRSETLPHPNNPGDLSKRNGRDLLYTKDGIVYLN